MFSHHVSCHHTELGTFLFILGAKDEFCKLVVDYNKSKFRGKEQLNK